jgi:glutaredoxin 3
LHREHDQSFTLDVVDLDTMEENDGPLIQMELLTKTGQKTVPNVFIRGQHIGGDSDLSELFDSGSLQRLLEGSDETEGQEM